LALAEARTGPAPKRASSNRTSVSGTDPDAKLRHKPRQRPHLVHRGQVAVDPHARCVVACLGEHADTFEGDALGPILDRARFACPTLESVGTDQGYGAERVWKQLAERGITAFVPPQRTKLPPAHRPARTDAEREAKAARERCKTARGVWSHKQRMGDAEGVVGELKNRHGLDRARSRGTPLFHVQLLLGCSALNMKRLATHVGQAAEGRAAAPRTSHAAALDTAGRAVSTADTIHWQPTHPPAGAPGQSQQLNLPIWAVGLSLN
jgi:hypothetical protein